MNWQDNTISPPSEKEIIIELTKTIQSLEAEKELLEIMVLQQRDFIAKAVHEARSHVRFIFFNLDMLFKVKYTPEKESEYGKLLYTIKESTQKYKNLLHNLTDYSFNEYGRKIIVKRESVQVNDYLQNITEEFTFYFSELGYTINVHFAIPAFEAVLDTMKFRQVVHSLLINATQHGEKGSINMAVNADPYAGTWNLTISNSYKQQSYDEANRNANLGLGMTISRQLIELMKGGIEIISDGQVFTVIIHMKEMSR